MSGILKVIAVVAGAGLAVTLASGGKPSGDEVLRIEPLLDRLEKLEAEQRSAEQWMIRLETEIRKEIGTHHRTALSAINSMERTLLEQSISILTLRGRAEAAEAEIQRLAAAIERPAFQIQLDRAMDKL